jgi:hypothetical protein
MVLDYVVGQGEYYDDVDDFLKDDPTLEVDIKAKGMKKRLRIRALTFSQMERISKSSMIEGKIDNVEFVLNTLVEGIVRPKFNTATARRLLDAHGETVKEIADSIWQLGRISKGAFDEYIKALQESSDLPSDE